MFRITFVFLIILSLFVGCNQPVIGGIDSDNMRGELAKKKLLAAANSADIAYVRATTRPGTSTSGAISGIRIINSLLIPIVSKLDDKKFYLKDNVKACTTNIYALSLISDSLVSVALSCDIKEAPFFSLP